MIWKLLKQHISMSQLVGFFFANLCGMTIVLVGIQFYCDILPVFTQGDSFIKKDYLIISKKVSTLGSFIGRTSTFSQRDIDEISEQPFCKSVGCFIPAQFNISAGLGIQNMRMSTDMFFESVPDKYVDVQSDKWTFEAEIGVIPIIVPRNYLNLYNFGFAQSRKLPQLSEGVMGMINLDIRLTGNGQVKQMKGNIVGFSNRLNTILVPESFMNWANAALGSGKQSEPSRLIVEVANPTDDSIVKFVQEKGYETEGDQLDAGKTVWFLKIIVGVVLSVGLLICILSIYILVLSIYLLLQKNTTKLENLMLIGYSPSRIARPYQGLTIALNALIFCGGIGIVCAVRAAYMEVVENLFPQGIGSQGILPALLTGGVLFMAVCLLNIVIIRRKINFIWWERMKKR